MTEGMFYDGWQGPLRAAVVGACAYVALIVLLRATGKRTLSKMNAFDLVITVALGSTLAATLLNESIALVEGLTGLAVLVVLQLVVTWLSVRSAFVRKLVRAEPSLLFYRGEMLGRVMASARVTESEVLQAVRAHGLSGLEQVDAVVLESDGSLSVTTAGAPTGTALRDVPGVATARK